MWPDHLGNNRPRPINRDGPEELQPFGPITENGSYFDLCGVYIFVSSSSTTFHLNAVTLGFAWVNVMILAREQ